MSKPDFRPKRPEVLRASPPTHAAAVTAPATDVGDCYSITIERHAITPKLWRLRERRVVAGELFEFATDWKEFPSFTPSLGMAQGRLKGFLFPQFGARVPQMVRRGE